MMKIGASLGVIALAIGGLATTQANALERWLYVHNESGYTVCEVYISHVDTSNWGRDLLGSYCLDPGEYMKVDPGFQNGYCMMDLKFVYADGDYFTEGYYNICEETDYYIY